MAETNIYYIIKKDSKFKVNSSKISKELLRGWTPSDKQYKIISTKIFEILTLNLETFLIIIIIMWFTNTNI